MIRRLSETLLLRPADVTPLRPDFAVVGVFNPGAVKINDEVVLVVRVAEKPSELRPGFVGLPRWDPDRNVVVDWVSKEEFDCTDPRIVRGKMDRLIRPTSLSHLRVYRSRDERSVDLAPGPIVLPASQTEEYGIEDPRVTEIGGTYWITYVAVSRYGAATALASTVDFNRFARHGIVFCPENKDVVLFPLETRGQFVALHRPSPNMHFGRPQMWLARSPDLLHWGQHECLFRGSAEWESDRVGAGTPPIALEEGWLEIYHGSRWAGRAGEIGAYSAGALLLDRENPAHILRRSCEPIMQPTADFERTGFVPNVVFPTALVERGETLCMYYGASDTFTAMVEFSRRELLAALY